MEIEALVVEAMKGNKTALEGLTAAIQDNVYYLALRMLVNPEDAKDATQEILIKVITKLSTFKFESQFKTWVYRIATNYLLSEKKVLNKDPGLTFSLYQQDLESGLQDPRNLQGDPEYQMFLNELRISCTMAMLLCLKPQHRIAYIIGDILEMEHGEASKVLSISKDNFRQQLSRARSKVVAFTAESCGLVNHCAKCHCERKITGAVEQQRIVTDQLFFANATQYSFNEIKQSLRETQQDLKTLALQQSIKAYKCPIKLGAVIESLVVDGVKANKA